MFVDRILQSLDNENTEVSIILWNFSKNSRNNINFLLFKKEGSEL